MKVEMFQGRPIEDSPDRRLLVALRPSQVLNELASRVGRETYFGMVFWWFNSALVGTFDRDTFSVTYRSRGVKSLQPRLSGSVRAVPGGTQVRYRVDSNMLVNLGIIGLIGLVMLGIVVLVQVAPYMEGRTSRPKAPADQPRPARMAPPPLSVKKGLTVAGVVAAFFGSALAVRFFVTRAQAKSLDSLLPRMFAGSLILDAVASKEDGVADVLPG